MELILKSIIDGDVGRDQMRKSIIDFQEHLIRQDGSFTGDSEVCPVKHYFADGVYMREMFIPKGAIITGKVHNLKHINVLVSGTIEVLTEDGHGKITGPCSFVTRGGIMKVGHALTDCIWINCHPNPDDCTDLKVIEKRFVSETFEEYQNKIDQKSQCFLNDCLT